MYGDFFVIKRKEIMPKTSKEGEMNDRDQKVENALLLHFVNQLTVRGSINQPESLLNKNRFLILLEQAWATQTPLVFIAIGCPDWIKMQTENGDTSLMIGKLHHDNKRIQRFALEMASFSQALSSFGIPHRMHFSLSDIQAHMTGQKSLSTEPQNTDLTEILESNDLLFAEKFNTLGIPIYHFKHSQVLAKILGEDSIDKLPQAIARQTEISLPQFLFNLYELDLQFTATHFVDTTEKGPVWLDIQSANQTDENSLIRRASKRLEGSMPFLSLFPNAGDWHASHRSSVVFPKREDLIAQLLGLNSIPQNTQEWMNKIHKIKDEKIIEILRMLGQDAAPITSGIKKTLAVRTFFKLVFSFDPLENKLE